MLPEISPGVVGEEDSDGEGGRGGITTRVVG